MKEMYTDLFDLNHEQIREYQVRNTNHQELMKKLKEVNNIIQHASKLRGLIGFTIFLMVTIRDLFPIPLFLLLFLLFYSMFVNVAGDAKSRVVNECRKAIKNNNMQQLFSIIRYGKAKW